jgi:transcriptional regulator with XRE-family HTH domain
MNLGDKILQLRKKNGLSQEQLGEKVDVTRQTISNWELGETTPNPEQLKKCQKHLMLVLMKSWIMIQRSF